MKHAKLIGLLILAAAVAACGQNKPAENSNSNVIEPPASNVPVEKQTNSAAVEQFTVRGFSFSLFAEGTDCVLSYKKGELENTIKLSVPAPCKVVRMGTAALPKGDKVIVKKYPDIKSFVFMVGGDVKKAECKYETAFFYQPILVKINEIKMGAVGRMHTCLPEGPDEPEWWIPAHDVEKPFKPKN